MRVLITGITGQIGADAAKELIKRGIPFLGLSSQDLDITDRDATLCALREYRPDAVLHCAAYTKVDHAEDEAERCMLVNAGGTRYIAEACREFSAKLLFVSTDYVFPGTGNKPWETYDPTKPLNVYGRSKLAGEDAVRELTEKYFIVRTSWLVGTHGSNFVKTMLRLAGTSQELCVVNDQIGSPTFSADLVPLLCDMLETEKYGVYHATNEGFCSWADLAEAVFLFAGKDIDVRRISTEEYGAKAHRPKNSRLSKTSLDAGGFMRLPAWETSLAHYLERDSYP